MKSAEPNLCVRWEGGEQQSERWCGGELPVIDVPFVDDKGVVGKEERQRIHIAKRNVHRAVLDQKTRREQKVGGGSGKGR